MVRPSAIAEHHLSQKGPALVKSYYAPEQLWSFLGPAETLIRLKLSSETLLTPLWDCSAFCKHQSMTNEFNPSEATLPVYEDRLGAGKTSGPQSEAPADVEMQDVNDANGNLENIERGINHSAASEEKGPEHQDHAEQEAKDK